MPSTLRPLIGAAVGALVGFALYRFVGCKTGACPLTGNPWIATILWALIGMLAAWR